MKKEKEIILNNVGKRKVKNAKSCFKQVLVCVFHNNPPFVLGIFLI